MTIGSTPLWLGFIAAVVVLLVLDLVVVHRRGKAVSMREAALWSAFWVGLSLAAAGGIAAAYGTRPALEFLSAYTVEKALSVDNLFVFLVLFSALRVDRRYRHGVLFWGVFGALVLRGAFIVAGTALLDHLHFMIYVFGGLLIAVGAHTLVPSDEDSASARPRRLMDWLEKKLPTTSDTHGGKFFVREDGRLKATRLVPVLVAVELTDLIFAVDSVPAALGVSRDPFIVFSSNALAILGLRSLFFLLEGLVERLAYLRIGLAVILVFIGTKMALERFWHVSVVQSIVFIVSVILITVVGSLIKTRATVEPSCDVG